jgi:hypothetical protein
MKKLFTLFIALLTLTMGAQNAYASLRVTIKSGMNLDAEKNFAAEAAVHALYITQQMYGGSSIKTNMFEFYSIKTDKLLFVKSTDGVVIVSPKLTDADDIFYSPTIYDLERIREEDEELYEYLKPHNAIYIHFEPYKADGNLVGIVKTGEETNHDNNMAILFLYQYFNQIKREAELDVDGEFTGNMLFFSMADKLLFIQDYNTGIFTIADGITSADNIIFTITDEDRERLMTSDIEAYQFISSYKTIELHFDTGGGGNIEPNAMVGTVKTGTKMDAYTSEAVFVLRSYFNQIKMDFELDGNGAYTGRTLYSSKADKLLFILDEENTIILADDVTSADDIIYTITDEDRNRLQTSAPEAYLLISPYTTVELHFEVVVPKVQAVTFDFSEITLRPGQELQLDPHFTPTEVKDKTLRYVDVSNGHHVYIDSDNGIIFAQSEGVAYIEAFSSYTASGEEVMATWGPTQEIYLKITITALEPGQEVFFDYKEGEGTEAPTISCHVLRDEVLDVNTWVKTCEIAGPYNEDDITTLAIPEWRTGTVNIPEEAMGYEVVRVGAYAFYESQISALYIPWTVTQIGREACSRCDYLTDVYIASFQPLQFTDAYGEEDENLWNNDAFYRIGEGDDGEGYATLHVLPGSKAAWDIYPWNEWFRYIKEDTPIPVGIKGLTPNPSPVGEGSIYNLAGQRLSKKQKGINIVDGKKVMMK